jgi:hypothetical protein
MWQFSCDQDGCRGWLLWGCAKINIVSVTEVFFSCDDSIFPNGASFMLLER